MDLQNKVVWITGGARMGSVIAQALSARGCSIVVSYRQSQAPAQEIVQQLISQGHTAIAVHCDISRSSSVRQTLKIIQKRLSRLNGIVNLASIYAPTAEDLEKSWDAHMDANARSAYLISDLSASLIKKSGGGRIVHISDWTSASGRPRYSDYSAYYVSKLAVKGVVEAMALRLAPDVFVNAIAPGPILPPPGLTAQERRAVEKATPVGHWGGVDEIAKAVLFLMETDFITGETLRVDGGRHLL